MSEENQNPDYVGPEANALRAEANKFGDQRHQLLDAANAAFQSGDKAKAKQLSEQGKEAGKKMEESNKKAAEVILKHRNSGHPITYLDLHGLFLAEAMSALTERLDSLRKAGYAVAFEVIPGAGNHSKAGAVIKPKVIEELTKRKLVFVEKNAGTILVTIEGKPQPPVVEGGFATATKTNTSTSVDHVKVDVNHHKTADKQAAHHSEVPAGGVSSKGCCIVM